MAISSILSKDLWDITSKVLIESISSSKNSILTAFSLFIGNISTIPPLMANCPSPFYHRHPFIANYYKVFEISVKSTVSPTVKEMMLFKNNSLSISFLPIASGLVITISYSPFRILCKALILS